MISGARLLEIRVTLRLVGKFFGDLESFQNRARIGLAAPEVVNLARPRRADERRHEARDVQGMNVVAHLFSFVPENLVFPPFEIAFHEVAQKAVELDTAVIRTGET